MFCNNRTRWSSGFTLIELLIVVVILGIAGAMVIPQMGSVQALRVHAAVRTLVSDLTFAQADAIAFQRRRAVVFDLPNQTYRVVDVVNGEINVAQNTLYQIGGPGGRYVVNFRDAQFAGARIEAARFDGDATALIFDDLGGPVADPVSDEPGAGGRITIAGLGQRFDISIEPYTGRIVVRRIQGGLTSDDEPEAPIAPLPG